MGLQDIIGKLGGQGGQEAGLANIQSLFGGGGIQGIVTQMTNAGLGQHAQSWVGTNDNRQVSGQQIQQAMDPSALQQVAQQTGLSSDQIANHVAQVLPQLVDKATPDGQVPASDPFSQGAGVLKGLLR